MRARLFNDLGITSSAGIAHNKVLAKLGGSINKPNNQTVVFHETALELMRSLPNLKSIPGLGSAVRDKLRLTGITDINGLQSAPSSSRSDIPDFRRIQMLSLGIDESPVKLSGKPLSIGLEDRFKSIVTKKECEEKAKWLLSRLSLLLLEDGRWPSTIKVTARDLVKDQMTGDKRRFNKQSRQCKVSPTAFKSESSILNQVDTVLSLLEKMIDFAKPFHLTLLGIAVTDFEEQCSSKEKTIESFFKKASYSSVGVKRSRESVSSTEHQTHPESNTTKRTKNEDKNDKDSNKEAEIEQSLPQGWDQDVFASLPSSIQQELLSQRPSSSPPAEGEAVTNSTSEIDTQQLPPGWDPDVFESLPDEVKDEIMQSRQAENSHSKAKSAAKKSTSKNSMSILNYFGKSSS